MILKLGLEFWEISLMLIGFIIVFTLIITLTRITIKKINKKREKNEK